MLPILSDPPCGSCNAVCCRQNNHDFAVLLDKDESYPESIPWVGILEKGVAENVLPYVDGACVYLKDGRCGIYENRPRACREFNCWDYYKSRDGYHGSFVEGNPEVEKLLDRIASKA